MQITPAAAIAVAALTLAGCHKTGANAHQDATHPGDSAAVNTVQDVTYLHQQLAAHLEALTLHGGYADHGDNAALKAVAAKVKPVVQHHIAEIRRIGGDKLKDAT
jgi:hypothetical protein